MSNITNCEWRDIPETEGWYSVSREGEVRSNARNHVYITGQSVFYESKTLKPWIGTTGYYNVSIRRNGKSTKFRVHHLVAEAFIGPRPNGQDTRHLDGNPLNNRPENLSYGSRKENMNDAREHGTTVKYKKLSKDEVIKICKLGFTELKTIEVAKMFGVSRGTVCDIWNARACQSITEGIRPTHRGKVVKVTQEQVNAILKTTGNSRTLSKELGICRSVIKRVRKNYGLKDIPLV